MDKQLKELIYYIELHDAEGIRECFINGADPNDIYRNKPLIYELTSEYTRSPRFSDCVKAFVDAGLNFEDKILLAVLLNDAEQLNHLLTVSPGSVTKEYTLRCAYTAMYKVSLLHICAEFNHVASAATLLKHGLDINRRAGYDENGFGSQTAIFHTVNQNSNQSIDMLHFLLANHADTTITVPGLIWGKGYEWETLIPAVNPVSYAMMGLLPQMHRDEKTVAETVALLLKYTYNIGYTPKNIPNAYLNK